MDFCQRAHTALEREEPGRAMMMLVHGLRREPGREEGLDLLLFIYVYHIKQPGMESEFVRALEYQDQRGDLLRLAIEKLENAQKLEMAAAVKDEATRQGIDIAEPATTARPDGGKAEEQDTESGAHEDGAQESSAGEAKEKGDMAGTPAPPEVGRTASVDGGTTSEGELGESAETEGEASRAGEFSSDSEKSRPVGPRRRWRSMSTKRRILSIAGGALAVVITASIVVVGWQHARDVQHIRAVDRAMLAFDPQNPAEVMDTIDEARAPTRDRSDELDERERFVASLIAFASGEKLGEEAWLAEPETSWGLAASAFMLAQHEEWEEAMQFVNLLERAHADTLPAYFARGRICEERRQWDCAAKSYGRVLRHFDEFMPARMGAMRVAAHRFDVDEWTGAQAALAKTQPDHLYTKLRWLDPFDSVDSTTEESVEEEVDKLRRAVAERDQFVEINQEALVVLDLLRQERWIEGAARCRKIDSAQFGMLPVLDVACAKTAAGSVNAEMAEAYWEWAAQDSQRSSVFFRRLQQWAPQVLVDLGRAEAAIRFAIPVDAEVGEDEGADEWEGLAKLEAQRPAHFQPLTGEPDAVDAEALLTRSRVLSALGATEQARSALEPVTAMSGEVRDRAYFELVWSYLTEGDRRSAVAVIEEIERESLRRGARAHIAYLDGDYGEASGLVDERSLDVDARLVRVKTLALHADGRGRDAIATIADFDAGLETLGLIPVRERVFARSDAGAEGEDPEEDETISGLNFLIDRGAAKLWRRDLATADRHLTAVLEVAPNHPEANWKMGILRRVEGRNRDARVHFRRAWRGAEDTTELLIEAGRVQLEAGQYDRAREIFLRAALRDRRNVEALRGLGEAYQKGDRKRGRRDLPNLLRNYSTNPANAPARVELNRWSAIVHDSRRGDEKAFHYLETARDIGGDRVPVLVEMGRYFEARAQWEDAREHYGTALRINPTLPEIHLAIARVSEAKGDRDAARDHLAQTMRLGPVAEVREEAEELDEKLNTESDGD